MDLALAPEISMDSITHMVPSFKQPKKKGFLVANLRKFYSLMC